MRSTVLFLFITLLFLGCFKAKESLPEHKSLEAFKEEVWFDHFRNNRLDSAIIHLDNYLDSNENELPAMAYYAEALYRQKRSQEANRVCDSIILLDSTFGWAYQIKGELRRAQYGTTPFTNRDSSNYYLQKAATVANPSVGVGQILWIDAMESGEIDKAKKTLRDLYKNNHYSSTLLAYGRVFLKALPDSAILITNGDFDTYVALAVQESEGLRTDVAILNMNLLNIKEYIKHSTRSQNINHQLTDGEIEAFEVQPTKDGYYLISDQLISVLKENYDAGISSRPLCLSGGIPLNSCHPRLAKHFKNRQYHLLHSRLLKSGDTTSATYEELLEEMKLIKAKELIGNYVPASHQSPVILASFTRSPRKIDNNFIFFTFDLMYKAATNNNREQYDFIIQWQDEFLKTVGNNSPYLAAKIEKFRTDSAKLLK